MLEFIGIHGKQGLVEDDLEKAILTHLQEFMQLTEEVARQKATLMMQFSEKGDAK